jgi:hypothetical protein
MAIDYLNWIFTRGSIPDISLNMNENKEFNESSDNEINIDTAGNNKQ